MEKYFSWHEYPATQLIPKSIWQSIYELICQELKQDHQQCTELGSKIAKSLINIAATRIFADPSQSILEIPVNSVDAYLSLAGMAPVGKFGMGFFSFLYWLIGHPQRQLTIVNYSSNGDNYICYIQEHQDQLQYHIDILPSNIHTLLTIELLADNDPFTEVQLLDFEIQLQKLRFIDTSLIIDVEHQIPINIAVQSQYINNMVDISINKKKISVTDNAGGISMEVLKHSLLLPSVSTKTIQASIHTTDENLSRTGIIINNGKHYSTFSILVANIAVVDLTNALSDVSFVIDMQRSVGVPVSRDDILVTTEEQAEYFYLQLEQIFILSLGNDTLNLFYSFVKEYERMTNQQLVKNHISNLKVYIPYYAQAHRYILHHPDDVMVMANLQQQYAIDQYQFRSFDDFDFHILEQQLSELGIWRDNLYLAKYVATLNMNSDHLVANNLHTGHYLAVNTTIDNWYSQIPLIYIQDRLIIKQQEISLSDKKLKDVMSKFKIPPELYLDIYNLGLKILSLNAYFRLYRTYENFYILFRFIVSFIISIWYNQYDLKMALSLIQQFYAALDKCLPTHFTYGKSKSLLILGKYKSYFSARLKLILNDPGVTNTFELKRKDIAEMPYDQQLFLFWGDLRQTFESIPDKLKIFNKEWLISCLDYLSSWPEIDILVINPITFCRYNPTTLYASTKSRNLKNIVKADLGKFLRAEFDILLDLSNNVWQYYTMFYCLLLFQSYVFYKYQYRVTLDEYKELAEYLSTEIQIRYTTNILKSNWLKFEMHRRFKDQCISTIIQPIFQLLNIYWDYHNDIKSLPTFNIDNESIERSFKFKASDFISYVFNNNIIDLNSTYNQIITSNNQLQTLEIAINEGTTKDYIAAVMTELSQNAIDAMRLNGITGDLNINVANTTDVNEIALSVSDPVGMNQDNIISLMVPFLSTKTPSELVTGQLGSGFFNVYRLASKVMIDTSYNGLRTVIEDTPIYHFERIIDLQRKVNLFESQKNGTIITLILKTQDITAKLRLIAEIYNYANSVLKLMKIKNIDLKINGRQLINHTQVVLCNNQFESWQAQTSKIHEPFTSYILTNGIPFGPLNTYLPQYLQNMFNQNIIINLSIGQYQAVQSRTKIIMNDDQKIQFHNFILQVAYIALLDRILGGDKLADRWLDNFSSIASITQLWFDDNRSIPLSVCSSIEQLITYGDYLNNSTCIANEINKLYDIGLDQPDTPLGQFGAGKIIPPLLQLQTYVDRLNLLDKAKLVVYQWLITKNKKIKSEGTLKLKGPKFSSEQVDFLNHFTQHFVNLFWQIGQQLQLYNTNFSPDAPITIWREMCNDRSTLGFYNPSSHRISLNLNCINLVIFDAINQILNNDFESPLDNTTWLEFFGMQLPASTVIHELSHAWRRSRHRDGHGPWTYDGTEYNFETAANYVFSKILEHNFYPKLISRVKNINN